MSHGQRASALIGSGSGAPGRRHRASSAPPPPAGTGSHGRAAHAADTSSSHNAGRAPRARGWWPRPSSGGHQPAPNPLGDLGDDGVAEGSQSVHPSGNPMSHSTHVGFNAPFTAVRRLSPPSPPEDPGPPIPSDSVGVGQRATNVATDRLLAVPDPDRLGPFQSDAVGVPTDNPDAFAEVRGADVSC